MSENRIYRVLSRVCRPLSVPIDRSLLDLGDLQSASGDESDLEMLVDGAGHLGIALNLISSPDPDDIVSLLTEGMPIVIAMVDGTFQVYESCRGTKFDFCEIGGTERAEVRDFASLRATLASADVIGVFAAKPELGCQVMASSAESGHEHSSPLRRLVGVLKLDARDIWMVVLFATVEGVLGLATPLAVESLVNVVSWGTYLQPLLVIATILMVCLAIAAVLKILQTVVVELIQRRQFVRIVGDLAHRFPRANRDHFRRAYPRELANRIFDIMTIQKSSAMLLLDGVSILLTTVIGLVLLGFYHPFLLGFDIVLVISMVSVTWVLGRGGISRSIDESIIKYKVVHWLQDVIASPAAFKINGGELMAIDRANQLSFQYLQARRLQFRVVLRQSAFAVGLQVVASTAVLGLGGWLVFKKELTLGQLVASELVVTVVVGAFAKAGKLFEKFYDLMAGIDKVGHLLDLPVDPRTSLGDKSGQPATIRWEDIQFKTPFSVDKIRDTEIASGSRVAITGSDYELKSRVAKMMAGLETPSGGFAEISGIEAETAALESRGKFLAFAGVPEIVHATLQENVGLGRDEIGMNRVREVLQKVGLWSDVNRLPDGMQTKLQSGGYPLSEVQSLLLTLASAMAGNPKLLVINGLLDRLPPPTAEMIFKTLASADAPWTLVVVTDKQPIIDGCDTRLNFDLATSDNRPDQGESK